MLEEYGFDTKSVDNLKAGNPFLDQRFINLPSKTQGRYISAPKYYSILLGNVF